MAKTKEFDIVEWIELSYTTKVWKYLLFEVRTSSTSSVIRTDFMGYSGFWLEIFLASYPFQISEMQEHTVYKRKSAIFFLSKKKFSKTAHFHKRQIPHPVFLIDLQVSTTCINVHLKENYSKKRLVGIVWTNVYVKVYFELSGEFFIHFYEYRRGMGIITQNSSIWFYTITLRVLRKNWFSSWLTTPSGYNSKSHVQLT